MMMLLCVVGVQGQGKGMDDARVAEIWPPGAVRVSRRGHPSAACAPAPTTTTMPPATSVNDNLPGPRGSRAPAPEDCKREE